MSEIDKKSNWPQLFLIAKSLLDQVNDQFPEPIFRKTDWTLGGGTAMMLQTGHRESYDIDIFFDPQFLNYLNPELNDFHFDTPPNSYGGDGSNYYKYAFADIGQIDFIGARWITENHAVEKEVLGSNVLLERIPEIVTKKVYYRGDRMKPRDIFDIAVAEHFCRDELVGELAGFPKQVGLMIDGMAATPREAIREGISKLVIREGFQEIAASAVESTHALLMAARQEAQRQEKGGETPSIGKVNEQKAAALRDEIAQKKERAAAQRKSGKGRKL